MNFKVSFNPISTHTYIFVQKERKMLKLHTNSCSGYTIFRVLQISFVLTFLELRICTWTRFDCTP